MAAVVANQSNSLVGALSQPLRWLFQSRPMTLHPNQDAQRFVDDFENNYGNHHPQFHIGSYQSAVLAAFQQAKFLVVYLHSPIHDDTNRFCTQLLCSNPFMALMEQNAILWAGRVWDPEAYSLSSQLGASAFPFVALLMCQSNRSVQIVDRIQGYTEGELTPMERINTGIQLYGGVLNRSRVETQRREEAQRLREQQDREYLESIELERLENERREREENERRQAEEEKKQQEELAAAIALSEKLHRDDEIRHLKERFSAIPEPDNAPDVSTIRFQLPRGKKLTRRFQQHEPAQRIFDFLSIQFIDEGDITKNFTVSTQYPKMEITDKTMSIAALGLHPRGMLYVQDIDA